MVVRMREETWSSRRDDQIVGEVLGSKEGLYSELERVSYTCCNLGAYGNSNSTGHLVYLV